MAESAAAWQKVLDNPLVTARPMMRDAAEACSVAAHDLLAHLVSELEKVRLAASLEASVKVEKRIVDAYSRWRSGRRRKQ